MRIPFSSVRRRSHAGALFDIENTVNRWVKTEHKRYRENVPNEAHKDTRYLKVVTYHFSSVDPLHQGCAAHGSNDELAAAEGRNKLSLSFSCCLKAHHAYRALISRGLTQDLSNT